MLGSIIGAAGNLLGGFLNSNSTRDNNAALIADKEKDRETQKEFAQNGIQWKAADALKAGIHPLYAMGANTVSYAPSTVGTSADTGMGAGLAAASQDLSRAATATASEETRQTTAQKSMEALTLTKAGLENELLAAQVAKTRAQIGPPIPTLLSPDGNKVKDKEMESTAESIPETRSIRPLGMRLNTNPKFSDAESLENRYGNLVEGVGGIVNLGADMWHTGYPWLYQRLLEKQRSTRSRPGLE